MGKPVNAVKGKQGFQRTGRADPPSSSPAHTSSTGHASEATRPDPNINDVHAAFVQENGRNFISASDGYRVEIAGTSKKGSVYTDFETLQKAFGEPGGGDGDKTSTEWALEVEDPDDSDKSFVVTIYDWKNYAYDPEEGIEVPVRPVGSAEWMVGGHDNRAIAWVEKRLQRFDFR